jgi:hypothetical protein
MKEQFNNYLKALGLTETLTQRVLAFHDFCSKICPEEIARIFVSDYVTQEEGRVFESVWFFSNNYAMEAKEFTSKEDYDIAVVSPTANYISLQKQDYDLVKATEKSRLLIKVRVSNEGLGGITGNMRASGENCDFLWVVTQEYFIPRIKVQP